MHTAEHLEHLEHSEHLPTEPMPAYEASHCLNESVAPKGSWVPWMQQSVLRREKAECWDSRRQLWAFAEVVYNGTDGAHSQLPASALAKRFGEVPGVVLVDLGRIGVHPRRPFAKDSTPTRLCRRWAAGSACLDSSRALQYVRQCA